MPEITPTWVQFTKIWWSFTWRQALITAIVGFTLAALVAVVGVAAGFGYASVDRFVTILILLVSLFASIVSLRSLFSTEWKGFRIALVPIASVDSSGHIDGPKASD